MKLAQQKNGREQHKNYNYGEGVAKEDKIGPGARVDGIGRTNKIIYELKPNNASAIKRGLKQLQRYLSYFDENWKGVLKVYDK